MKVLIIMFYDLLFYSLVFLIISIPLGFISKKEEIIISQLTDFSSSLAVTTGQNLASELITFFFTIIGLIILGSILIIVDYSILKGVIWNLTLDKKIKFKKILKYFYFNLVWLSLFIILIFLIDLLFKSEPFTLFGIIFINGIAFIYELILLDIWIYLSIIISILFFQNKKQPIKSGLRLGFTKIHHFIIPYLIILIFGGIIYGVAKIFVHLFTSIFALQFSIIVLLFLIYSAWIRYYMVQIVDNIDSF